MQADAPRPEHAAAEQNPWPTMPAAAERSALRDPRRVPRTRVGPDGAEPSGPTLKTAALSCGLETRRHQRRREVLERDVHVLARVTQLAH